MIHRTRHCHVYYFKIKNIQILFQVEFILCVLVSYVLAQSIYKIQNLIAFCCWIISIYAEARRCVAGEKKGESCRESYKVKGKPIVFEESVKQACLVTGGCYCGLSDSSRLCSEVIWNLRKKIFNSIFFISLLLGCWHKNYILRSSITLKYMH